MRAALYFTLLFLVAHTSVICQIDSVMTLKIEKCKSNGKQKEIFFNPQKRIDILIRENHHIVLENIDSLNNLSIFYKNGVYYYDDILKVHGYKLESLPKKAARSFLLVTGSSLLLISAIARFSNPFGGSEDDEQWARYKQGMQKFKYMALIGVAFAIGGTTLSIRPSYDTKNQWTIKNGYYKYDYIIINDGPSY
jgi:hypothetical protein